VNDTSRQETSDYSHWYHAGNVGDVWKHCALVALLEALPPGERFYLETHAGTGRYALGATGEWTEGAGRLAASADASLPPAAARYLEVIGGLGFRPEAGRPVAYPGSPALALSLLGPADSVVLHELAEPARASLVEAVGGDPRVRVQAGDGLAALGPALARGAGAAERVVLVDPPYVAKEEWSAVPDALVEASRCDPGARLLLWYPIKSMTRPEALLRRLRAAALPTVALELITTPLELKRNRLNGSGVLLVNAPPATLAALAAAAPAIGSRCATHEGRWWSRALGWG